MSDKGVKYILAIDLGTTGAKSALISTAGEIVDRVFEKTSLKLLPEGGAEQDPDEWWNSIITSLRKVLSKGLVPADKIVAISCTTQWSGTIPVEKDGSHLMNAIIWMDCRGSSYIKKITGGPIRIAGYGIWKLQRWLRLTGGIPAHSGKDSIAHILYIKYVLPEIYKRTYKFLEPKDYINLRFTGRFMASYDSITLHWVTDNRNISHIEYDDRLIRWSTIDREKLPEIRQAIDILGPVRKEVAEELGIPQDVKVVVGAPDMHTAALGSGAVKDYVGHLYIGTSSWLTCHVPYKKTDLFHNMASLPSTIPGRYFVTNEQETAGTCLTFLKDNILFHRDEISMDTSLTQTTQVEQITSDFVFETDIYKTFDRIVERVPPGSDGVIFTPWLYGERTPVENSLLRAAFFNLSLRTNRTHLLRAVYEGVAYNSRWLLHYVERFIGRQMNPINLIGGGALSNVWCQIHADVSGRIIQQVSDPIMATIRGAAFVAAVALGYMDFQDIPKYVKIARVFQPERKNRRIYDELYEQYLRLYRKNRKIYESLNKTLTLSHE